MIIHPVRQWGTVQLVLFEAQDEPVSDGGLFAFIFETAAESDVWNVDTVLKNLICQMNMRNLRTKEALRGRTLAAAHTDDLEKWIKRTSDLVAGVRGVYGDRLGDMLEHVTGEIKQALSWPALHIQNPPRDPKGRADLFLTVTLWVFERIRETFEALCNGKTDGIPRKEAARTILLAPSLKALQDAGLPYMESDKGWTMRLRSLRVREGHEDQLIADVLSACRNGPFDRDGLEIGAS